MTGRGCPRRSGPRSRRWPRRIDPSVQFTTTDGTATVSDRDYTAKSGTLTFLPGQTSKTITVAVRADKKSELDETFLVNLLSAEGASIADGQGVGTIVNDDGGGSGGKRNSFASAVDAAIEDWMLYGVWTRGR